jgi:hypothetical protein
MRLINVRTLALQEFFGDAIPPYAILSHTWNGEEVTYQDWQDLEAASKKAGYRKIKGACQLAEGHGYDWLWVDTNCIDKSSSAELSEAINSMFQWYQKAGRCYAYLIDVESSAESIGEDRMAIQLRKSRWFTRGWTLQELLAPNYLTFYAADWTKLGSKDSSLISIISSVTGIDVPYLTVGPGIPDASVAKKMSWLAKRKTTRVEDMAYCMLGLFDINMPLLYGEGMKAFTRLQEEIIRVSNDHTIFCWSWNHSVPRGWVSFLAPAPNVYERSGDFVLAGRTEELAMYSITNADRTEELSIYSMTNAGLSIRVPILRSWKFDAAVLNVRVQGIAWRNDMICIPIKATQKRDVLHAARIPFPQYPIILSMEYAGFMNPEPLIVMARRDTARWPMSWDEDLPSGTGQEFSQYGLIFTFETREIYLKFMCGDWHQHPSGAFSLDIEDNVGIGILRVLAVRLGDVSPSNDTTVEMYVLFAVKLTAKSTM